MYPIYSYGSEEQRREYLPKLASGKMIGCFGLTEHEGGSDPGSMRTTARMDGESYVLNGSKMWITNGSIADIALVWASDDDGIVRGFLVPTDTPGFTANKIERKMSMRASVTSELVMARLSRAGDCDAARCSRIARAAVLSDASALWHYMGCTWRDRVCLSGRSGFRAVAPNLRPADSFSPARAGQVGEYGCRSYARSAVVLAAGCPERQRRDEFCASVSGEARKCSRRAERRQNRAGGAGRLRYRLGSSGHSTYAESRDRGYIRRNARHTHDDIGDATSPDIMRWSRRVRCRGLGAGRFAQFRLTGVVRSAES